MASSIKLREQYNNLCKIIYGKRCLIDVQYKNIINCPDSKDIPSMQEFISNTYGEIAKLEEEKSIIERNILMLEMSCWNLISNNEEIDLYKVDDDIAGTYFIYIHNTTEEVGFITYDPKYSKSIYGDISYTIYDDYQGNGYAFKALCILSKFLKENNVEIIRLSTQKNNIPSVRTIEKYEMLTDCKKTIDAQNKLLIYDFKLNNKKYAKNLMNSNKL